MRDVEIEFAKLDAINCRRARLRDSPFEGNFRSRRRVRVRGGKRGRGDKIHEVKNDEGVTVEARSGWGDAQVIKD